MRPRAETSAAEPSYHCAAMRHPMLNIAVRAARRAGEVIVRDMSRIDTLEVGRKGRQDYVTSVDLKAEKVIIDTLRQAYPKHAFRAEESGESDGAATSEYVWIIDPLDGTMNYLHGFPQFCVSIALEVKGEIEQAVVYDPLRNELFEATRGRGAQLDGRKIRVSKVDKLGDALIGTGFPVREMARIKPYLASFEAVITEAAGIRRAGAAALDLAYVACGRLDGFWETGLSPWDVAAGMLLVEEAGGIVTDLAGRREGAIDGNVVAGTPKVHGRLLERIRPR